MANQMQQPVFVDGEFMNGAAFTAAAAAVLASQQAVEAALHTPGVVNPSALGFSSSGLVQTVSMPAPFAVLFSSGLFCAANGTTPGSVSTSASVNLASFVPGSGSQTVYLVVTQSTVQQGAYQVTGPPQGHPDYDPTFAPFTAYASIIGTLVLSATLTPPDNTDTIEVGRFVLSAGATSLPTVNTTYLVHASVPLAGLTNNVAMPFIADCDVAPLGWAFYTNATANTPTGADSGVVLSVSANGNSIAGTSNTLIQIAYDLSSSSALYYRNAAATATWSAWSQIATTVHGYADFEPGSVTFTVPAYVYHIKVRFWAGGGGGGGGASGNDAGGGGGGGGYCEGWISVTPGQVITGVVGGAGTAGTPGASGTQGGNSAFYTWSAQGGFGGAGAAAGALGAGGAGGSASGAALNANGGAGLGGTGSSTIPYCGGFGGAAFGGTINPGSYAAAGLAYSAGAGGGGGANGGNGGTPGAGLMIIEW